MEIVTIEDEAVRAEAVVLARRRTPIVTDASSDAERRPVTVARSRKKDAVTIRAFYIIAVNSVLGCPCPCAVVQQFLLELDKELEKKETK